MRAAFIKSLTGLAKNNKNIFLLTGDLGYSVFEPFIRKFPGRFFNIGVAEANMVGIAAGLALSGKAVFIYSIVPFVTMRCFEQIRNDLCLQKLNVKIIGVGAGLTYGTAGPTHYSIEDIAIMRSLPNMTVVCPGDPFEAGQAIKSSLTINGPVYVRLGKTGEPNVNSDFKKFKIGKARLIINGSDLTIMATGNMLYTAMQVVSKLRAKGVHARLISMHTIKPLDRDIILKAASQTKAIFTIEEHILIGGLGSAVAEVVAEAGSGVLFKRLALPDSYPLEIGSQSFLRSKLGLGVDNITGNILKCYRKA